MKLKAIIILFLVSLHCLQVSLGRKSKEDARIVIIGAGPSGIAAASKLFENGFKNITILEAEDRIGGRVYTTKFGDYNVDIGGQFIDGIDGNVAYQLANPFGLVDESKDMYSGLKEVFFYSNGDLLKNEITDKLFNFFSDEIYEAKFENVTTFKSVGEYTEQLFNERFKDSPDIISEKKKYLFYLESLTIGDAAADTWNNLSISARNQYKKCEGDNLANLKNLGYSTVLDILMKKYPDPKNELPVMKNVFLNSEVNLIDYSEESDISITTTKGQVYKADHVIVTVSLGYLKENQHNIFRPKLPANKIDAIEAIGFGNLAKVYLLFDKPFWSLDNKRYLLFSFIWNDADRQAIEQDPEKEWLLGIAEAQTVQYKPNLLEFWISGKYGKLMEKLSEEKVLNHTIENLHRFLGKNYQIPLPIGMMRTQWFSNPHFKGAYSYQGIEADKKNVSAITLEEPLTLQNLTVMFAGEATSTDRYGSVDGAIGTGWRAANRLIKSYENPLVEAA